MRNEVTVCRTCCTPGHCVGPSCHRCRAAALEKLYAHLLGIGTLTLAIKKVILWTAIEHPAAAFKTKAAQRVAWNTMCLLCRPVFTPHQLDERVASPGIPMLGIRVVLFRNYKYLSARQRADNNSLTACDFKATPRGRGRRYCPVSLTCLQEFMHFILSFLF
jgi:hypothetical protein